MDTTHLVRHCLQTHIQPLIIIEKSEDTTHTLCHCVRRLHNYQNGMMVLESFTSIPQ